MARGRWAEGLAHVEERAALTVNGDRDQKGQCSILWETRFADCTLWGPTAIYSSLHRQRTASLKYAAEPNARDAKPLEI